MTAPPPPPGQPHVLRASEEERQIIQDVIEQFKDLKRDKLAFKPREEALAKARARCIRLMVDRRTLLFDCRRQYGAVIKLEKDADMGRPKEIEREGFTAFFRGDPLEAERLQAFMKQFNQDYKRRKIVEDPKFSLDIITETDKMEKEASKNQGSVWVNADRALAKLDAPSRAGRKRRATDNVFGHGDDDE